MQPRLMLDANVVIEFLRGRSDAIRYFQGLTSRPLLSAIVVAELYAGVRDGPERTALERVVSGFRIVGLSSELAVRGGLLMRQYARSHGLGLADALIAATAVATGCTLITFNLRHFPMLADVRQPY